MDLLRTLEIIVSDRKELSRVPSPVNLLFYELATTYEQGVSIDDAKNALVFKVLSHLATYDEHRSTHAVPMIEALEPDDSNKGDACCVY